MRLKVDVTRNAIRTGARRDSSGCAIAIGLLYAPNSVSYFVCDFDSGKRVKPFSFELELN